jgi:hypothetical protein
MFGREVPCPVRFYVIDGNKLMIRQLLQSVSPKPANATATYQAKTHCLVLHHVACEDLPVFPPAKLVEPSVNAEAFRRGIGHVERMMGVIVGKKTLTAEGEKPIDTSQPIV